MRNWSLRHAERKWSHQYTNSLRSGSDRVGKCWKSPIFRDVERPARQLRPARIARRHSAVVIRDGFVTRRRGADGKGSLSTFGESVLVSSLYPAVFDHWF
jgi:hypothetical protein